MYHDLIHITDFLALPVDVTPVLTYLCLAIFFLLLRGLFGIIGMRSKYVDLATTLAFVLCSLISASYIVHGLAVGIIDHMAHVGAYTGGIAP